MQTSFLKVQILYFLPDNQTTMTQKMTSYKHSIRCRKNIIKLSTRFCTDFNEKSYFSMRGWSFYV